MFSNTYRNCFVISIGSFLRFLCTSFVCRMFLYCFKCVFMFYLMLIQLDY